MCTYCPARRRCQLDDGPTDRPGCQVQVLMPCWCHIYSRSQTCVCLPRVTETAGWFNIRRRSRMSGRIYGDKHGELLRREEYKSYEDGTLNVYSRHTVQHQTSIHHRSTHTVYLIYGTGDHLKRTIVLKRSNIVCDYPSKPEVGKTS